jgi:hypothetical protein
MTQDKLLDYQYELKPITIYTTKDLDIFDDVRICLLLICMTFFSKSYRYK